MDRGGRRLPETAFQIGVLSLQAPDPDELLLEFPVVLPLLEFTPRPDRGLQGSTRIRHLLLPFPDPVPGRGEAFPLSAVELEGRPEPGKLPEAFPGAADLRGQGVYLPPDILHPVPEDLHLGGKPGGEISPLALEGREAALQDLPGRGVEPLRVLREVP